MKPISGISGFQQPSGPSVSGNPRISGANAKPDLRKGNRPPPCKHCGKRQSDPMEMTPQMVKKRKKDWKGGY